MVQILHGLARSAFPEIVETGDKDQASSRRIQHKTDVAKVRVCDVLQLRQSACRPDTHHRLSRVKLAKQSFYFSGGFLLIQRDVDGRENPARERQEVCRK